MSEGKLALLDAETARLLKKWDAKRDGKPVPVEQAREILTANANKGGYEISVAIELVAGRSELFKNGPSKKKPSSGTSRKASSSATSPGPSKTKPKRAASRSRSASKAS